MFLRFFVCSAVQLGVFLQRFVKAGEWGGGEEQQAIGKRGRS